jgi:hypothetical protein
MASTEVRAPFTFFADLEGGALEGGYIFIGEQNLNPLSNPKDAYWNYELTIPAANIRTSHGLPVNGSNPGRIFVDGAHSILVKDKNGTIVYSSMSVEGEKSYTDFISDVTKIAIDYGTPWGMMFYDIEYRAPSPWYPSTPETYWPNLCLTDIDTYADISSANWGATNIARLRAIKTVFKEGLVGALSSLYVTNWAIAANVATLTFANNADTIAALTSLLEDKQHHGSYVGWRTGTNSAAIGDIAAGTYALTDVNAGARTVSFAYTAANNSGAVTASFEFYAYRIAGSTTTARIFSARGLSIMGVNDANGYFVSGGLRRRGYLQGHTHNILGATSPGTAAEMTAGGQPVPQFSGSGGGDFGGVVRTVSNDGVSGTARYAKETNSPALSGHLYVHFWGYAV